MNAQKEMAKWAFYLTVLTVGSMLLSALALIGLFVSLRQTRKAITDNREIGEAQSRAYVWPDAPTFIIDGEKGNYTGWVRFVWKNSGASPAINCISHTVGLVGIDEHASVFRIFGLFKPNPEKVFSIAPHEGQMGLKVEFTGTKITDWIERGHVMFLFSHVEFEDVFGKKFRVKSCLRCLYKDQGSMDISVYKEHNQAQTQIS